MRDEFFGGVRRRRLIGSLGALAGISVSHGLFAAQEAPVHDRSAHMARMAATARAASQPRRASYEAPAVQVLDQFGREIAFDKALDDGRPVILNFIFTSCTTICPVMSQIFMQVQARLAAGSAHVHMVSVSIDPEYDTPARLLAYARQCGAGAQWDFYTGSTESSVAIQKAFDAFRGDKMNHEAVTLVRGARGKSWLRLDGFVNPETIVDAYRAIAT